MQPSMLKTSAPSRSGDQSSAQSAVQNLGKIGDADLSLVPQVNECNTGLEPVEYNVILATAVMAEKIGSIYIPETERDRLGLAMQVGRIIAQSPIAFNYDKYPGGTAPQVGDIVWFARYAGGLFDGLDGREYRIVKDKDIGAIIRPKKVFELDSLA